MAKGGVPPDRNYSEIGDERETKKQRPGNTMALELKTKSG
jgi:hypothetical protein